MFSGPFDYSIIKRALVENIAEINFVDLRDFGIGRHKSVDDKPFGGGAGMILRVDVVKDAIDKTLDPKFKKGEQKIVLLSAGASSFNQEKAEEYSKLLHLIIICGHYEGIDARIKEYIDEEISIGDFILTGGEIPAMIITDSVVRLLKGVLKENVTNLESFSGQDRYLEYPQYTRPSIFNKKKVPGILLSGNHQKIDDWRKDKSIAHTKKIRPDLIKKIKTEKNLQNPLTPQKTH